MTDERDAFEEWLPTVWTAQPYHMARRGSGYRNDVVNAAWDAWRGGIAWERTKDRSPALTSIHEAMSDLHDIGAINDKTMTTFGGHPIPPPLTAHQREVAARLARELFASAIAPEPQSVSETPVTQSGVILEPRDASSEDADKRFTESGGLVCSSEPITLADNPKPFKTLLQEKPWKAEGISRTNWLYRQRNGNGQSA